MAYQKHIIANSLKALHKIVQMLRFVTLCYVKCYMAMQGVTHVTNTYRYCYMLRMRSGTLR